MHVDAEMVAEIRRAIAVCDRRRFRRLLRRANLLAAFVAAGGVAGGSAAVAALALAPDPAAPQWAIGTLAVIAVLCGVSELVTRRVLAALPLEEERERWSQGIAADLQYLPPDPHEKLLCLLRDIWAERECSVAQLVRVLEKRARGTRLLPFYALVRQAFPRYVISYREKEPTTSPPDSPARG